MSQVIFTHDAEFSERGPDYPIILISIGVICEDGREFYRVSTSFREEDCNEWVRANVLPKLPPRPKTPDPTGPDTPWRTPERLADELKLFVGRNIPEFWGSYSAYDHVVLSQLFGTMVNLPKGWPMYTRDLKQWADMLGVKHGDLPPQEEAEEHNARADAKHNMRVYRYLRRVASSRSIDVTGRYWVDAPDRPK